MKNYNFILSSIKKNFFISLLLLFKLFYFRKLNFLEKRYNKKFLEEFKKIYSDNVKFSSDFFSYNIKYLVRIFYKYKFINKDLNILEIGSYEGRSTIFFLTVLKNSKIQCVDMFQPSEELLEHDFEKVFKNFMSNINQYKDRVKVFRGKSDDFFNKNKEKDFYDLIYIDGNHHYEYVLRDAENAFKALKKNGIMIFDDLMWKYYDDVNHNPIGAIKEFIAKNYFKLKIISISYQIAILKT